MIKQIAYSILFAFSVSAAAQSQDPPLPIEQCVAQIPYGQPVVKKHDTAVICRKAYLLEHDNKAKIPQWVSYTLKPENATGCEKRMSVFKSDRSLPADKRAELKDYAKSGYDTGHIANSADMSWNPEAARESFILSNMTPQLPQFNRGIWKKLEDQTRAWAINRSHTLLIYAGPIYNQKQDKTMGANLVTVPNGFYKIIIDTQTNEAMVFRFNHEAASGSLTKFLSSLAQVQKETGIVFPVPKSVKYADKIWPSATKSAKAAKAEVCAIN
jgi:endonuclease G